MVTSNGVVMSNLLQSTLGVLGTACASVQEAATRSNLYIQACRNMDGGKISHTIAPVADPASLNKLNRMVDRLIKETGQIPPGCAVSSVPDGPDVYVAVMGDLSDGARSLIAQTVADRAARLFTGPSLA